jgi:hypothetical protein
MTKLVNHVKSQAVAYAALFVALGGTSYAAIAIPKNSVGSRQLRNGAVTNNKLRNGAVGNRKIANGSVTPAKLNGKDIAGTVAMWARISPSGTVVASKPQAQVVGWDPVLDEGNISWGKAIPAGCWSLVTVDGFGAEGFATVATANQPHPSAAHVFVGTFNSSGQHAPEPVNVAVVCP